MDSITVTSFVRGRARDVGVYCRRARPPIIMSSDNRLEVTLMRYRGQTYKGRGFRAKFAFVTDYGIKSGNKANDVACGYIYQSTLRKNGSITSPNYPGLYPRLSECHYFFYGKPNELIKIHFTYFDVDGTFPKCTEDDYVEFSNFNLPIPDRKMMRYCGRHGSLMNLNDVISDGNFFRVSFISNEVYDGFGFEAQYQFIKTRDRTLKEVEKSKSQFVHHSYPSTLLIRTQLSLFIFSPLLFIFYISNAV